MVTVCIWGGVGCLQRPTPLDKKIMTDRLLNFLITDQLPLGSDNSELRHETILLGDWLRSQIKQNNNQSFLIENYSLQISVKHGKDQFRISQELMQRLVNLQRFFIINYSIPKSAISADRIQNALSNPISFEKIKDLIRNSMENNSSETGGIATISETGDCLHFYCLASENQEITLALESAKENPDEAMKMLRLYRNKLDFLSVRASRTLDILSGSSDRETQIKAFSDFLDLFKFYSQHSYILGQQQQYAQMSEYQILGYYLGSFHVHPKLNRPSSEDRAESLLRRNLVIVPTEDGFELHYLANGSGIGSPYTIIRYP